MLSSEPSQISEMPYFQILLLGELLACGFIAGRFDMSTC